MTKLKLNRFGTQMLQTANIGYMTLTGFYDLCGAFSHDRYGKVLEFDLRKK